MLTWAFFSWMKVVCRNSAKVEAGCLPLIFAVCDVLIFAIIGYVILRLAGL